MNTNRHLYKWYLMFGSEVLEVAIGIIFIFLLISIICSAVREGMEAWLKTRAAYLEFGIRELLHDTDATGLAKSFFNHPLIYSLFSEGYNPSGGPKRPGILANGANLPSYIPARNFAQVLMDIAVRGPETDVVSSDPNAPVISIENIRVSILNLKNPAVQRALLMALDSAQGDINKVQAAIEAWYDSSMDRVSGWYKRATHWILFWIGLFVAVALNINPITIANYLYRDDAARAIIVSRAEKAAGDTDFLNRTYAQAKGDLESLSLPIGWDRVDFGLPGSEHIISETRTGQQAVVRGWWDYVFLPLLGWALTALATTMGAPFWFDLLNKVMVIRSTVKPHEKSQEEDSEDRQLPKPAVNLIREVSDQGGASDKQPIGRSINPAQVIGLQPMLLIPDPMDEESAVDACIEHGHDANDETTTDDQLPPAEGGVELL